MYTCPVGQPWYKIYLSDVSFHWYQTNVNVKACCLYQASLGQTLISRPAVYAKPPWDKRCCRGLLFMPSLLGIIVCVRNRQIFDLYRLNWEKYPTLGLVWFIVLNATFNNISVVLWWSALLVDEIRVHRENQWPVASHWQTLSQNVVLSTPRHEQG